MKKIVPLVYDFIAISILVTAGIKLVFMLESSLDIGLSDETYYLTAGVNLFKSGLPHASHSPLYAIWYYLLSQLESDRIQLYYLNYKLITVFVPLFIYLLLRRYDVSVRIALFIASFFLICRANLPVWPKVSHFAIIVSLLFFIAASYVRSSHAMFSLAAIGALTISYIRPEFFLTYVFLLVLYFWRVLRERKRSSIFHKVPTMLGIILASTGMLAIFGIPMVGKRSFVAFGQHFSVNWVKWTGSDLHPWLDWKDIISQNFPHAQSIFEACVINPLLLIKHILYNAALLCVKILKLLSTQGESNLTLTDNQIFPMSRLTIANGQSLTITEFPFLFGIILLYLFYTCYQWRPLFKHTFERRKNLLVIYSAYLLPSLVSAILIFPRDHYLFLPIILGFITLVLFVSAEREKKSVISYKELLILGTCIVLFTPWIAKNSFVGEHAPTIRFIQSLNIQQPVNMLEAEGGYAVYLGDNFHEIRHTIKTTNFFRFLDDEKINMIVVTNILKGGSRYKNDQEWHSFLDNYRTLGYTNFNIPGTQRSILLADSLLFLN